MMPYPQPVSETHQMRPALSRNLTGAELRRWYWLKDELVRFARTLGIRTTGSKDVLIDRVAAFLDGPAYTEHEPFPRRAAQQLTGPLTPETIIPQGQRCSQVVRGWLAEQVGPTFHFDAAMRDFFARADGTQTMQDSLEHWYATRGTPAREMGAQFEFNRFTRSWFLENPDGSRSECLTAWKVYRSRPVDERGKI